jgi:adenylate cyclase
VKLARKARMGNVRRWAMDQRVLKAISLGIATGLLGILTALTPVGAALEEDIGLFSLFRLRGSLVAPSDVAVIRLDRESGKRLGVPDEVQDDLRFWPRSDRARLIDSLVERGASVIVLDMWLDMETEAQEDAALADAIARSGRVVLIERLESRKVPVQDEKERVVQWMDAVRIIPPITPFATAAQGQAPFPLPTDSSRVNRFWSFLAATGNSPTLPAVTLQIHALPAYAHWRSMLESAKAPGIDRLPIDASALTGPSDVRNLMKLVRSMYLEDPGLAARLKSQFLELEKLGTDGKIGVIRALAHLYGEPNFFNFNFYGPAGTLPSVTFADFFEQAESSRISIPDLRGKVVFVGWAEPSPDAITDRKSTVFVQGDGVDLSGVEVIATAFANLLDTSTLRLADRWVVAFILALFGLTIGAAAYLLPTLPAVLFAVVAGTAYIAIALHLFSSMNLWVPLAIPLLIQLPSSLFTGLVWQQRNMVRGVRNYLPRKAADRLRTALVDRSETRVLRYGTCLITDAEGYTTLAEGMAPDILATLMNEYLEALFKSILASDGIVTSTAGDKVMSVWTTPQPDPESRGKAVLAALNIIKVLDHFNIQHTSYPLKACVGLHAGWVVLGNVGGSGHFAYEVMGDVADTVSRINGLNKYLGTRILASEQVIVDVPLLLTRRVGKFYLVGKSDALTIYEIMCLMATASPREQQLCELFTDALEEFEAQRWLKAAERFDRLVKSFPNDGPARFYYNLCSEYCVTPPVFNDAVVVRCRTK